MDLVEYINKYKQSRLQGEAALVKRLICEDGFSISVQASAYHYCSPRENMANAIGYRAFELGYPSEADEVILGYAEDTDHPEDTVYPYVPIELVWELLEKHGGIKGPYSDET